MRASAASVTQQHKATLTWADLREGLSQVGLDRLVTGSQDCRRFPPARQTWEDTRRSGGGREDDCARPHEGGSIDELRRTHGADWPAATERHWRYAVRRTSARAGALLSAWLRDEATSRIPHTSPTLRSVIGCFPVFLVSLGV